MKLVRFGFVLLTIAVVYTAGLFISRWMANREIEQQIKTRQAQAYRPYPGTEGVTSVKILQFYAAPNVLSPGERSSLCYSVYLAKSVRLDPPVEEIEPSLNRCLPVTPKRDTRYTLTAVGEDGKTATASIEVKVAR